MAASARQQLDGLTQLFEQPERFREELVARYHARARTLTPVQAVKLRAHVERADRAVQVGALRLHGDQKSDALIASWDHVRGLLYLLLVRDSGYVGCARVSGCGEQDILPYIEGLLRMGRATVTITEGDRALVDRWLHVHRGDDLVFDPRQDPATLAAAVGAAVRTAAARRNVESARPADEWWLYDDDDTCPVD